MAEWMQGVFLPGNSTVEFREVPIPEPGYGQVLVEMKASTLCGSDIRAIYREHLGHGPEAYQNVISGHEPCGQIVRVGPGCHRFQVGDRVILYHIAGCGLCHDCRQGYMISCTSPRRAAYGWQRDGGNADYLLAEEHTCVALPDELSYLDGACVACGFGTTYEALSRMGVSGCDRVLVVGLGPVGMSALMLARAMGASMTIGVDVVDERVELCREFDIVDEPLCGSGNDVVEAIQALTKQAGCEVVVDCSGTGAGRLLALRSTRQWGRCAFVGEGGTVAFDPSPDLIHRQITLYGSWVTSLPKMEDLVACLVNWDLHPEDVVTDKFSIEEADEAYALMDEGRCGKVAIVWPD